MRLHTSIIKTEFERAVRENPLAFANAVSMQRILFQGAVLDVIDYSNLENLKLIDTNLVLPEAFVEAAHSTNDPSIDWLIGNLENPDLAMVELTADVAESDIDIVKGKFLEESRKALKEIGVSTKFIHTDSSVDREIGEAKLILAVGQKPPPDLFSDLS